MAFKNFKGDIERNLQEQVRANKNNDIALAREIQILKSLADWGIRVLGHLDVWNPDAGSPPTQSYEYGDAFAVGLEPPYDYYIYTRGEQEGTGFWFNNGPISIIGPKGEPGERGPQGATGAASRWYVGPNEPIGTLTEGDMWLQVMPDGNTNGLVRRYERGNWTLYTSIMGPSGTNGINGKDGKDGRDGIDGKDGKDGSPSPVINIIGELPEGSVISDTYDPALVESNSGILMPIDGVNHLWIIINGVWTDSGSWGQGGTQVLVGGQEKTTVDLDYYARYPGNMNSVDRVLALTKNTIKTGKTFSVADASTVGTMLNDHVVRYGTTTDGQTQPSGFLVCHSPANNFHAATKAYVDNKIATEIAAVHGEKQHATLMWTSHGTDITLEIGLGFYLDYLRDTILPEFGSSGDFEEWGGSITFETSGGYVYINNSWHYNDAISGKLTCSFSTGDVVLYSIYPGGGSTGLPQEMATFSITNALINTANNLELSMQCYEGLPGGVFTVNALPG